MALIQKDYKVTIDSKTCNIFGVWNEEQNKYRKFRKYKGGLYNTDMTNQGTVLALATVKKKIQLFRSRQKQSSHGARKLQETMRNIRTKDLMYMIGKILIPNLPDYSLLLESC